MTVTDEAQCGEDESDHKARAEVKSELEVRKEVPLRMCFEERKAVKILEKRLIEVNSRQAQRTSTSS